MPLWPGNELFIIKLPKGNYLSTYYRLEDESYLYANQDRVVTITEIFKILKV